ncbi:hypothetical protein [Candidatus Marithrix sp. Canyon 246]|uniref:hypothetical protein n=1 Tax=Candidatus Marithrix sp. Canyon 246 TaxID=1827136 RepID=UPI00084A0817|nr:hypothetical protein [Candidatus Marithrix sp. Canyon 246]
MIEWIPSHEEGEVVEVNVKANAVIAGDNQKTFESSLHKDIYVIGDACIAGPMPKSAYAANTQATILVIVQQQLESMK